MGTNRGARKKQGQQAAKRWLKSSVPPEIVRVAGYDFDYSLDTLDDLRNQGLDVPPSSDEIYSWGFWKNVKGYVTYCVWKHQMNRLNANRKD